MENSQIEEPMYFDYYEQPEEDPAEMLAGEEDELEQARRRAPIYQTERKVA